MFSPSILIFSSSLPVAKNKVACKPLAKVPLRLSVLLHGLRVPKAPRMLLKVGLKRQLVPVS